MLLFHFNLVAGFGDDLDDSVPKLWYAEKAVRTEQLHEHPLVVLDGFLCEALQNYLQHLIEERLHSQTQISLSSSKFAQAVFADLALFLICETQASEGQLTTLHECYQAFPANVVQAAVVLLDALCQLKPNLHECFLPQQQILLGAVAIQHHRLFLAQHQYFEDFA